MGRINLDGRLRCIESHILSSPSSQFAIESHIFIAEIDKEEHIALEGCTLCDTKYGRFEEQKKRDVEQAYQKMSAAEKELFKQKMVEIDEADAGDGETPPPTLFSV